MDAREAIKQAITDFWTHPYAEVSPDSRAAFSALAANITLRLRDSGYRILHESQNHGPTVERAAKVAMAQISKIGLTDNPAYVRFNPADYMAKNIAAAIRQLKEDRSDA